MVNLWCKPEFVRFDPAPNWAGPTLMAQVVLQFSEKQPIGPVNPLQIADKSPLVRPQAAFLWGVQALLSWKGTGPNMPEVPLVMGGIVPGYSSPLEIRVGGDFTNAAQLGFQLSRSLISDIEDRRAGRDAGFGISVMITGIVRGETAASTTAFEPFGSVGLSVQLPRGGGERLIIPKSEWSDRLLPGLQFGNWKTVEYPITTLPPLEKVDEHIGTALRQFYAGEWRSCVESSRLAIQEGRTHILSEISPAFDDRPWMKDAKPGKEKLAASLDAFGSLQEKMVEFQSNLSGLLSPAVHPKVDGARWERPDAEFALELALACRRYVALRFMKLPPGTSRDAPPG